MPEGLNCCCYQLSIHLNLDYTLLWDKFRELHAARYSDTFDYVSPAMLIQYAENTDRPAYFLKNNQLVYKRTGGKNKGIAWQEHDGHCYVYDFCLPFHGMEL